VNLEADALLFDNDGVLVDSHQQVELAWRQLAGEFGLDFGMVAGELAGVRAADTLRRYLPPTDAARAVARLEDLEVELAATVRPLPGAIELLTGLPSRRWTIVTSASLRLAMARWSAAALPLPDRPITADDVVRGKPDPEPFLSAAHHLGVDPHSCLTFEDSSSGGAAAHAAGTRVVAVGSQPWITQPEARIQDLTQVTASYNGLGDTLNIHLAGT
jgi:sugar-phosphatase